MITFGSLFAGIGGFDLGFERAGMTCKWQVEIDPFCRQVLAKHWPDVPKFEDVRNVGRHNLPAVDLICGGFPCQDLSVAGKRAGLAGERSGLWFEFHRVLAELTPRWVVIENVPGLLSSNGGRDFAVILRGLVNIGYRVCWWVLDAQYFGVAQRRRRVFIVGHIGDGRAAQVLLESEGGAWDSPPSREAGQRIADSITGSPYADNEAQHRKLVTYGGNNTQGEIDIATAINAHGSRRYDFESETFIAAQCHGTNVGPMGHLRSGNGGLTGGVPFVAFDRTRGTSSGDVSAPLRACGGQSDGVNDGKADTQCIGFKWHASMTARSMGEVRNGSPPITDKQPGVVGSFGVRRLTPTECERLQGFPDGWTANGLTLDKFYTLRTGSIISQSDTQRYKQLGNAVNVKVAEWIGRRIVEADVSDTETLHTVPAGYQITECTNPDGSVDRVLVFVGDGSNVYIDKVLERIEDPAPVTPEQCKKEEEVG